MDIILRMGTQKLRVCYFGTYRAGYSRNQSDCQNGDPINGSCTIVNTLVQGSENSFTVLKDFSDNNTASVNVYLSCTSGTVTNNPQLASESSAAIFNIVGAESGHSYFCITPIR